MDIYSVLRYINDKISNRFILKGIPKRKNQSEFLQRFDEPRSDIERSFYQYKCQNYSCENKASIFIKNIFAGVFMCVYMLKRYSTLNTKDENASLVYISVNNKTDMLPDSIKNDPGLIIVPFGIGFNLNANDKKIVCKLIKKYPTHTYFVYKNMMKIGLYSYLISIYNPKEIVVNGETSFTSSILTDYCENKGILHTNVMHGEKVFWIRDSFFRFSKCYVWSDYHVDLFKSMRATESRYIVNMPEPLKYNLESVNKKNKKIYDYTFYLELETLESMKIIQTAISTIIAAGKSVKVRPHPVYTDCELVKRELPGVIIENCLEIELKESLALTRNVVAVFSTVLRQADNCGIRIIVDDCSNIKKYEEMKDLKFWLYENKPNLLSRELEILRASNQLE